MRQAMQCLVALLSSSNAAKAKAKCSSAWKPGRLVSSCLVSYPMDFLGKTMEIGLFSCGSVLCETNVGLLSMIGDEFHSVVSMRWLL